MITAAFREDIVLKLLYSEIFYDVDGYMLKKYRNGVIVPDEIEQEITDLIGLWKRIYTGRENGSLWNINK